MERIFQVEGRSRWWAVGSSVHNLKRLYARDFLIIFRFQQLFLEVHKDF